jgi:N-glycosylase/DNA lyase
VGFGDVAIIDRHILRLLKDKELISEIPKTLNKKRYLRIEKLLSSIASRLSISLGEMDLYLWYMKTGKVLK